MWSFFGTPGRSDHYYQNKGEYDLNQSNVESFVERVAKNNRENNSFSHKIHYIFFISLVSGTVHSSAIAQIIANLMEKTLKLTVSS